MDGTPRSEGDLLPRNRSCILQPAPTGVSVPELAILRQLREIARVVAEEHWHAAPLQLFHTHPRHRHSARAPVPRHGYQVVEPAALVTGIGSHTDATAVRQVDDQSLMAGSVTGHRH